MQQPPLEVTSTMAFEHLAANQVAAQRLAMTAVTLPLFPPAATAGTLVAGNVRMILVPPAPMSLARPAGAYVSRSSRRRLSARADANLDAATSTQVFSRHAARASEEICRCGAVAAPGSCAAVHRSSPRRASGPARRLALRPSAARLASQTSARRPASQPSARRPASHPSARRPASRPGPATGRCPGPATGRRPASRPGLATGRCPGPARLGDRAAGRPRGRPVA